MGGLAQGHWLGERAPESLYVAFSLTVTVRLPHLQLRHPHSRKEKDAEDVLLFIGKAITLSPFYWESNNFTRRPLPPRPVDFHLTSC